MKIDLNRVGFLEAMGLLTSVVPSRTPKPILQCVLISARKKQTRVCATDLEVGVEHLISGVEVDEEGQIAVPADRLNAIMRESGDDVIKLEATEDTCLVIGADSKFTVYGQKASDYPSVPAFEGQPDIELTLENLQAGIEQCLFATAKETSRYAINGVLWETKGKKLSLVATDGRRLARCKVSLASAPREQAAQRKLIVPAKTMALLGKIARHDKEMVAVRLVNNQVMFSCDGVVVTSNLVEGNFPNYEDIIPTDYQKKLRLSTEATLSAVRRAALLTSEESRGIKLSISKEALLFSGRAPETGDAQVSMAIDYKGEPMDIGFNPQFLADALRVVQTPEFDMELGEPDRPGVIKSGTEFLYVLMPISLA